MSDPISLVDWNLAAATARRLIRPGPRISYAQGADLLGELLGHADAAEVHVREVTGLVPANGVVDPTVVFDRIEWAEANAAGFQTLLDPLVQQLTARKPPSPLTVSIGRRVTGVEVGALLSFLAGKVLGQYEIFLPPGSGTGRLVLVAPNLIDTEQTLALDPRDFRLWVCLHEVTHRTQFTAVPWLRAHVQSEAGALVGASGLDANDLRARLGQVARGMVDLARGSAPGGLLDVVQTPEQKVVLDRITGFMSLLEGHADYVMDAVGPTVVDSLDTIRSRFEARRGGVGTLDRVIRRLIGIEAKTRQYREGRAFVREVVDEVGMEQFNRVWESPETLPGADEIRAPHLWMERVLRGSAPAVPPADPPAALPG
jgi:coenzyme F420 biosynthesis associated uncharacterized protein